MRYVISVLFVINCFFVNGQLSMDAWHKGMVVTSDKDTIRGKIKYDLEANIIQIESYGQIKALSSYKVFYVEFYDEILKNFRRFYTLAFNLRSDYQTPVIFEVLYEAGLSLLAREKLVVETSTANSMYWGPARFTQTRVRYDYYFLDKKGKITFYSGKRNELLNIMAKHRNEVKTYIKTNRLRTDNLADLVRITSFFNSI